MHKNTLLDRQDLFNIDLLILNKKELKQMLEVTTLDIFISNTKVFHNNGLFSNEIFGPVGNPIRKNKFGYIDLKISILHPLIFYTLVSMKGLYSDIISGKKYATWDNKTKDFTLSTYDDGDTGFSFFMEHANEIRFNDNDSDQRANKIALLKKYNNGESYIDKWLVLPAGLRDYTIDKNGVPSEDEINPLYRKLLSTVELLNNIKLTPTTIKSLDPTRYRIQIIVLEIYEFIIALLNGKNKFIEGKWAKRAIRHGTRNVITPSLIKTDDLYADNNITQNYTTIGLYQFVKGISPITKNKLHGKFINRILDPESSSARVVCPDTLTSKIVDIPVKKRYEWLSLEGLDNILNKLAQEELRVEPIMIDGYYLLLIYDDGKNIEIIWNTDTMREDINKKYIRPITYAELLYLAIYDVRNKYPAFFTRYPITGVGGIYPTKLYIKTTVKGRTVNFKYDNQTVTIHEYPILKERFVNSLSPHTSKLAKLGADHDGDVASLNILTTDESIKEINEYLDKNVAYIGPDGNMINSLKSDTLEFVLSYMCDKNDIGKISSEEYTLSTEAKLDLNKEDTKKLYNTLRPLISEYDLKPYYYINTKSEVYKVLHDNNGIKLIHKMQPFTNKDGYIEYVLTLNNGKKKHLQAQRLGAYTFHGEPIDSTMQVNHNDGVRDNNNISNLEWMTPSGNIKHSFNKLNKVVHNKGKKRQPDGTYA